MANLCPFLSLLLQFFFLGCCTISSYIGILVYAICWLLHLWILFMCNTHCLFVQTLRQSGDFNDHICSLSGDLYAMVPAEHLLIGFYCKFSTENCCNVWMRWLSIQLYIIDWMRTTVFVHMFSHVPKSMFFLKFILIIIFVEFNQFSQHPQTINTSFAENIKFN